MPLSQDSYMQNYTHTTLRVIQMDRLMAVSALEKAMEVVQVQAVPPWLCEFE